MTVEYYVLIAILLFIIYFAWKCIYFVGEFEAIVVERLGQYKATFERGIYVTMPFIDRPRKFKDIALDVVEGKKIYSKKEEEKIGLSPRFLKFDTKKVYTNDSILLDVDILLSFKIVDPRKAVYFAQNVTHTIEAVTETNLKLAIGEMKLEELIKSRTEVKNKIMGRLRQLGSGWGIEVTFFEIDNIIPPEKVRATMEEQMKLERQKRSDFFEAESTKKTEILRAEGYKASIVQRAEGDRHAEILRASGVAEARQRIAEAEAEAIKKIAEALSTSKIEPTQYLIATRYIEAMQKLMSADDKKVIYMPYEVSNIISSIGGIMDLFSKMSSAQAGNTQSPKDDASSDVNTTPNH
ncbi:SPFH/Band 7/PHB domain protein [candidate division KSB1 bacterium]|nr:SPFH/Band 7/PHB domain protein [candidate division KSB1 bacterium]